MKKNLLLLFICAFNILFPQFEKINKFQNKLIENEITGSNVALVWQNGKVIYHNIENSYHTNGKPINENSIFPIWSMSKPITIVAMMILKERGMIDFKDNVSKYLPEFKNLKCKNPDGSVYRCKNYLSVFHLLTHRSGYGYYGNPQFFTSTLKYNNLEDFSKDVASHPVEFEPGTDYLYGINMAILGRIIEVVTKKTFYEFLKNEIFNPLKMMDTKFYLTSKDRLRFQPLYINNESLKGYTNDLDELSYDINNRAYFGGEGLTSTLNDYSKFCQMLVQGGKYEGKQIISQKSIDEMTGSYSKLDDDPFDYGYSLFVLSDPELDGTKVPKEYLDGQDIIILILDRSRKNLFGLFMTRAREFSFGIQKEFRRAVYTSINN